MAKRKHITTGITSRASKRSKQNDSKYVAAAHTRSGRAITRPRESASFVDSAINIVDDDSDGDTDPAADGAADAAAAASANGDDDFTGTDADSSADSDNEQTRRRRLSQTPELEGIQDHQITDLTDSEEEADAQAEEFKLLMPTQAGAFAGTPPLRITLNVPPGSERQIILNIDRHYLHRAQQAHEEGEVYDDGVIFSPGHGESSDWEEEVLPPADQLEAAGLLGKLPGELRNKIYNHVFKADNAIEIGHLDYNFHRSAALLRTCKLMHEEGRTVLYGANHFILSRRSATYGGIWSNDWQELGYIPARTFLKDMGAVNVGLIRTITLKFTDAAPSLNSRLPDPEDRRFTNDPALRSCIRQFIRHGALAHLHLDVQGRSRMDTNYKYADFLDLLCQIQADSVGFKGYRWQNYPTKVTYSVQKLCENEIVREERLYRVGVYNGIDRDGRLIGSSTH